MIQQGNDTKGATLDYRFLRDTAADGPDTIVYKGLHEATIK